MTWRNWINGPANPGVDAPPPRLAAEAFVAPVSLWLAVQVAALGLSAAEVPLWARAPSPIEQFALPQLLVVQVVVSALTFPWLMPNLAVTAALVATAAPTLLLARVLSPVPSLERAAAAWAYVALWLTTLGVWSAFLRRGAAHLAAPAVAMASAAAIGVPVVRYLDAEFGHQSPLVGQHAWAIDPVAASLLQLRDSPPDARPWLVMAAVLAIGAVAYGLLQRGGKMTAYPQS